MAEKAVHVFVEGRVQGVWYRGWTQREAEALGLNGWVRNLNDGRVEAVFAGDADAVDDLVARCYDGPPLASVTAIMVTAAAPPETSGFHKRPTA